MNGKGSEAVTTAGTVLRFDLPFSASPAGLTEPGVGLHRMIGLAGPGSSYVVEATLLDVADHRLIRSGVELAHRVIAGNGDWYLSAPDWAPLLPAERTEPLGGGDIPDELADLVLPFRRLGTLGPVAAVSCDRQLFELRGDADQPGADQSGPALGRLHDDRVTIRRGGLATARYREITIEPGPAGLTEQQRHWLDDALAAAGGTRVQMFPGLPDRIGTPATGLTDYPRPRPVGADTIFENFVEAVLASGLQELIAADLTVRSGDLSAADRLHRVATELRAELNGLSAALGPDWVMALDEELGWFATAVTDGAEDPVRLRSLLRRERYLRLLDALVTAVRAPQLGEAAGLSAAETVSDLLADAVDKLVDTAGRLRPGDPPGSWDVAATAAEEVGQLYRLAGPVVPKRSRRNAKRLRTVVDLLIGARDAEQGCVEAQRQSRFVTPAEAFDLGRGYQQHRQRRDDAQQAFFDRWPRVAGKLDQS